MNKPPNILLLTLGKNRKIISSKTHQLSCNTNPLTVLLIPPNNSPTGSAGIENGMGAVDLPGTSADKILRAGETTGAGSGGHEAGGCALYDDKCL